MNTLWYPGRRRLEREPRLQRRTAEQHGSLYSRARLIPSIEGQVSLGEDASPEGLREASSRICETTSRADARPPIDREQASIGRESTDAARERIAIDREGASRACATTSRAKVGTSTDLEGTAIDRETTSTGREWT